MSSSSRSSSSASDKMMIDSEKALSGVLAIFGVGCVWLGIILSVSATGVSDDLQQLYPNTQIQWPDTISAMVRDPSKTPGRLFMVFEVVAAILFLTSRFTLNMPSYPGEQFDGVYNRIFRLIFAFCGMIVVAGVNTVTSMETTQHPDEIFLRVVHLLAATAAFVVHPFAEVLSLVSAIFPSCACWKKAEKKEEAFEFSRGSKSALICRFVTAILALMFFIIYVALQIRIHPLDMSQWNGLNVWSFAMECCVVLSATLNMLIIAMQILHSAHINLPEDAGQRTPTYNDCPVPVAPAVLLPIPALQVPLTVATVNGQYSMQVDEKSGGMYPQL